MKKIINAYIRMFFIFIFSFSFICQVSAHQNNNVNLYNLFSTPSHIRPFNKAEYQRIMAGNPSALLEEYSFICEAIKQNFPSASEENYNKIIECLIKNFTSKTFDEDHLLSLLLSEKSKFTDTDRNHLKSFIENIRSNHNKYKENNISWDMHTIDTIKLLSHQSEIIKNGSSKLIEYNNQINKLKGQLLNIETSNSDSCKTYYYIKKYYQYITYTTCFSLLYFFIFSPVGSFILNKIQKTFDYIGKETLKYEKELKQLYLKYKTKKTAKLKSKIEHLQEKIQNQEATDSIKENIIKKITDSNYLSFFIKVSSFIGSIYTLYIVKQNLYESNVKSFFDSIKSFLQDIFMLFNIQQNSILNHCDTEKNHSLANKAQKLIPLLFGNFSEDANDQAISYKSLIDTKEEIENIQEKRRATEDSLKENIDKLNAYKQLFDNVLSQANGNSTPEQIVNKFNS